LLQKFATHVIFHNVSSASKLWPTKDLACYWRNIWRIPDGHSCGNVLL